MKRVVAVFLFFSVLLLQAYSDTANWIDSLRVGDKAYFLHDSNPRIEIYDLASRQWMPPIPLSRAPTAFHIDEDYLFIGYSNTVYRYAKDGSDEAHVGNYGPNVCGLFTDGDLLIVVGSEIASCNKLTGASIDSMSSFYTFQEASFCIETNTFYGRSTGLYPADILRGTYDDSGELSTILDSPFHGLYDDASETFVWPDGGRVTDSSGNVYDGTTLQHLGSFATSIDDLAFRGDNIPIVLNDSVLHAFSNAVLETGSKSLGVDAATIYTGTDDVAVFYKDESSGNGMGVLFVGYDEMKAEEPGQSVEANGLAFTPDDSFIDKDDVVCLLSKTYFSIFRYDTNVQTWVDTIPLLGAPDCFAYSPANDRIYTAYSGGKVYYIDLNEPEPTETIFANLSAAPQGMVAAGEFIVTANTPGAWQTRTIWNSDGAEIDRKEFNDSLYNGVWNETLRIIHTDTDRDPISHDGKFLSSSSISGNRLLIRVKEDGSIFILGNGLIYEASSSLQVNTLNEGIEDATWIGDELFTLGDGTVKRWLMPAYAEGPVLRFDGEGLRLFSTSNNDLALLYIDVEGFPEIGLFDESFDLIAPPVLEAPVISLLRHSALAITLEWSNVTGEEAYLLERKTEEDGEWLQVATIGMDATQFTDNTVSRGNIYHYRMKASNDGVLSPSSNELKVDQVYGPIDPDPVEVPTTPFEPDSAFIGNGHILYLFSKSQQILYRWDIDNQTWISGIHLQHSPEFITYSKFNHAIYTVDWEGRIFALNLSRSPLVEESFANLATRPYGIIATGDYIVGADSSGSSTALISFAPDGTQLSYTRWGDPIYRAAWSDINRKIYHFADQRDLAWSQVNEDGTFGDIQKSPNNADIDILHPIRVKPNGTIVILGTGRIINAITLEPINMLPNWIDDATWIDGDLFVLEGDSIINYTLPAYAPGRHRELSGMGFRILTTHDGNLLVISLDGNGMPFLDVLDKELRIIAPEVLVVPVLEITSIAPDEVLIQWSDVSGEDGYVVERLENESSVWIEIGTTEASTTQLRDNSVVEGFVYQYRVKAINGAKESGYSNTGEAPLRVPDQVMDVTAIADSKTQVTLMWDDVAYESGYVVKRISQGQTVEIATLPPDSIQFVDVTVLEGTNYKYSVIARNEMGEAPSGVHASVTTPPPAPSSVTATAISALNVQVSWDGVENVETYTIERALEGSQAWSPLATQPYDTASFIDTTVDPENSYIYRVTASNAEASSNPNVSNEVTTPEISTPDAPQIAVVPRTGTDVEITWEAQLDAESYDIYRREFGEPNLVHYETLDDPLTSFVDFYSEVGHQYEYAVVAVNRAGRSPESNLLLVKVLEKIELLVEDFEQGFPGDNWVRSTGISIRTDAPVNSTKVGYMNGVLSRIIQTKTLNFMDTGSVSFDLRAGDEQEDGDDWKNSEADVNVYLDYFDGTNWIVLTVVDIAYPSHRFWERHSIKIPSEIIRKIESLRWRQISLGSGSGQWAIDNISITTGVLLPPERPALVVAGSDSTEKVVVYWLPVQDASFYIVERSSDAGDSWDEVAVVNDPHYHFVDGGLNPVDRHYYRISAGNSQGISQTTNALSAFQLTPLQEWRVRNYNTMENIGESADSYTAPNGSPNLLNYALGMDIHQSVYTVDIGESGVGALPISAVNDDQVTVTFNRRKSSSSPGIRYIVYTASELDGAWVAAGDLEVIENIDDVWEKVQWTSTSMNEDEHFFRLVVKADE